MTFTDIFTDWSTIDGMIRAMLRNGEWNVHDFPHKVTALSPQWFLTGYAIYDVSKYRRYVLLSPF